jgi:predicted TIM-barrel fold metal-dependent hydrolase
MNLHIAVGTPTEQDTSAVNKARNEWNSSEYAKRSALVMLSNVGAIGELTTSGIVGRYPDLKWISVESGFGYIPFLLETLDWQWHNSGALRDHPNQLLPSEAFRQSVYGSFWFERESMALLEKYPDNIMFETDYPHPTSLSPGPASTADPARIAVKKSLSGVPDDIVRKVLFENAAGLFKVGPPTEAAHR